VFYALGDGITPFRVSMVNIFLNAVLAYVLVQIFGAPGLVLATVVNLFSMFCYSGLDRKLNGCPGSIACPSRLDWWQLCGGSQVGYSLGLSTSLGQRGLLEQLLQLSLSGLSWHRLLP